MRAWGSFTVFVIVVVAMTAIAWRGRTEPVRCSGVETTFDYAAGTTTFRTREDAVENAFLSTLGGRLGAFTLEAAGPETYVVHWADEAPARPMRVGVSRVGDGYLPTGLSC